MTKGIHPRQIILRQGSASTWRLKRLAREGLSATTADTWSCRYGSGKGWHQGRKNLDEKVTGQTVKPQGNLLMYVHVYSNHL